MGLIEVAQDLYAVTPAEFTAQRNAAAAALRGTDREQAAQVRALPKPSVAAWAVNTLVRRRPEVIAAALDLGGRLTAAQGAFDGAALRTLAKEQQSLLADLRREVAEAARAAGQSLSDTAVAQVEGTVRAAMADTAAARAVASGLIVRDLQSSGFEPVDLTGAVAVEGAPGLLAVPETVAHPAPAEREGAEQETAEQEAPEQEVAEPETAQPETAEQETAQHEAAEQEAAAREAEQQRVREARAAAEERLAAAEEGAGTADRSLRDAQVAEAALAERSASLAAQVDELARRLEGLRGELSVVRAEQRGAAELRKEAALAARAAERELTKARAALELLPPPG